MIHKWVLHNDNRYICVLVTMELLNLIKILMKFIRTVHLMQKLPEFKISRFLIAV